MMQPASESSIHPYLPELRRYKLPSREPWTSSVLFKQCHSAQWGDINATLALWRSKLQRTEPKVDEDDKRKPIVLQGTFTSASTPLFRLSLQTSNFTRVFRTDVKTRALVEVWSLQFEWNSAVQSDKAAPCCGIVAPKPGLQIRIWVEFKTWTYLNCRTYTVRWTFELTACLIPKMQQFSEKS